MLTRELRALSDTQLQDRYEDLKESLYKLRLSYATGNLTDTSEFKKTKREIARILTLLRERELEGEE